MGAVLGFAGGTPGEPARDPSWTAAAIHPVATKAAA
jgi:hypothetical protein